MHADKVYKFLAQGVLDKGKRKGDRTGTGTISLFGPQVKYNLREGFPLLTTKKLAVKTIIHELLWFVRGDTDLLTLLENNVNIWTDDAYRDALENGFEGTKEEFVAHVKENQNGYDLGPIYGHQWRSWPKPDGESIDQLNDVIEEIRNNPDSRRLLVTAWNPSDIPFMTLPPCHVLFQFYVQDGELSCKMYQRSADVFLGVPFNIASYALLVHLVAKMTGLKVGDFIHTFGDTHIYSNHEGQVREQLAREPRPMPQINIKKVHKRIEDYTIDDIEIIGYDPHAPIKGKLSVGL
jgi:thymidylate synthase